MDLGSSFVVPASRSVVFGALLDPEVMRACIPGCEELERDGERVYRGRLQSEIAHVRFNAAFSATITEFEEPVRLRALLQGEDRRIASSIRMDVALELAERGPESEVSYRLELALWGRIGRLGEAIVRRRSAEVQQEFEAALLDQLDARSGRIDEATGSTAPPEASPATESPAIESPTIESPAIESPAIESPAIESPVGARSAAAESPRETGGDAPVGRHSHRRFRALRRRGR